MGALFSILFPLEHYVLVKICARDIWFALSRQVRFSNELASARRFCEGRRVTASNMHRKARRGTQRYGAVPHDAHAYVYRHTSSVYCTSPLRCSGAQKTHDSEWRDASSKYFLQLRLRDVTQRIDEVYLFIRSFNY